MKLRDVWIYVLSPFFAHNVALKFHCFFLRIPCIGSPRMI